MNRLQTLEQLQRVTRARICATCKRRSADGEGKGPDYSRCCEEVCPLFIHLPVLRQVARQLDPMIADREAALARILRGIASGDVERNATSAKYGMPIIRMIEEMFRS